jgi:superfamily I DNA and/or RNA helicase
MHPHISGLSSYLFYENSIQTTQEKYFSKLFDKHYPIYFVDTRQSEEIKKGTSFANEGEAEVIKQIIPKIGKEDFAIVSPYNEQVKLLKKYLPEHEHRINTIDSYQGHEVDNIIISLVRSNDA